MAASPPTRQESRAGADGSVRHAAEERPMSAWNVEHVLSVHHWTDTLFSFTLHPRPGFRFNSGQFTMIGLLVDGKPMLRAYSMVSAPLGRDPGVLQHQGAERPADLAAAAHAGRRHGADRPQAGRHAAAGQPAARAQPVHARHRHRPGAVHEPDPRSGHLRAVRAGRAGAWLPHVAELAYERADRRRRCRSTSCWASWCSEKLLYYPTVTREPSATPGRITDADRFRQAACRSGAAAGGSARRIA